MAVPYIDQRPKNCRERLHEAGKAYPRSGCEACSRHLTGDCPHPHPNSGKSPTPKKETTMHHVLKTDAVIFCAMRDGKLSFTTRKDDRAFQAGDTVELRHYSGAAPYPAPPPFVAVGDSREPLKRRITFVLRGGQYGLEADYVGLALEPLE